MAVSLNEAIDRLVNLHAKGYVQSRRKGPTGIGYTLEQELGVDENNFTHPDFGQVELKAHSSNSGSMLTLLTYDRDAWPTHQASVIKKFGQAVETEEGKRINLYQTIGAEPNKRGFRLEVDENEVTICSETDEQLAKWRLESLSNRFNHKVKYILYVEAREKNINDVEHFWFNRATLMRCVMSADILAYLFLSNKIVIDLRLHLRPNGSVRNHGTAFRVAEKDFPTLFTENQPISLDQPLASDSINYEKRL